MNRTLWKVAFVAALFAIPALGQDADPAPKKAPGKAPPKSAAKPKAPAPAFEVKSGEEFDAKIHDVNIKESTITVLVNDQELKFKVTSDTEILGPLGGKVPKRLKDDRFKKDFEVKVTPADDGETAAKIVLGMRGKNPFVKTKDKMEKKEDE